MITINISRYKPYEPILLSQDVVLDHIMSDSAVFNAFPAIFKSEKIKQRQPESKSKPVLVFGEVEKLLLAMV
jgi:hypothetical protein